MEKQWKQFKQRIQNFYGNIKNRTRFLSNLKIILILVLIEIYTTMYDRLTKDMVFAGNQEILVIAGLAILFTLIYSIVDGIIESLKLKEVNDNNKKISRNTKELRYNLRRLGEEQMEINKLGSKYEYCWNYLKNWATKDPSGKMLLTCMEKIEGLADEHVKKEYEKIEEKERNFNKNLGA